ncbi:tripartite motif-containing protein 14 [Spea bombifrons]|uniref:tripartite motif-containing protein 14 n=1 Tax=Spea bombifrons TaxID=233779 RepID=UPI0023491818|nr:tripartite motif-containing protein 14 [Spea bombifrons]
MDTLVTGGTSGRYLSPLAAPSSAVNGEGAPAVAATCGLCSAGCPAPVLLVSCGHRFCLGCLESFWKRIPSSERPCPTCTAAVRQQSPGSPLQAVPCDRCPAHAPCSARWSCLTCGESYCPEHFQPHIVLEEGDMSGHRVCDAAGEESIRMSEERNLGRRCPEHRDRAVELFCGACRVCVCPLCPLLGTHKGHPVTLLQQEALHKKNLMSRCLEQLDQKRNHVLGNIQHIEQAADDLKARTLENKDSLTGKFTELRLLLDEEEKLAKKFIEDKTKLALWAYEGQIESCQEHINTINSFSASIRNISEQPDAIKLIQEYVTAEREMQRHMSPAELWHPIPVTFEHVEKYYALFTEDIKASFKEPLIKRLQQGTLTGNAASSQKPGSLIKTKLFVDRSLFLKHGRCPTLDPDTMHSKLRLSEDHLTVYCAWFGRFNSHHPYRFDKLLQVMSRDCYLSGSHYWEVGLLQAGLGWWIGITYPSIQRKGDSEFSRLGWNSGSWCIKRYAHEYWAFHKGERTALKLKDPPERVGIFLDYESGVLSFFDVTSGMKCIHTFRCRFTEPIYPALRLWDGMITMCRLD